MRQFTVAFAVAIASPALAAEPPSQLDGLVGDWVIADPQGKPVGRSKIVAQVPGVMLFEERVVGDDAAQPLWFADSERDGGWVQLFVGASSKIRAFRQTSPAGVWPLIMTGDVVLRDGTPASFRMTMSHASADESRRLLEMSKDQGKSWSPVFDYTYRRAAPVQNR